MSEEFKQIFELELQCWCAGLARVRERVEHSVLHQVIKEFAPVLREAIERRYAFDLVDAAQRLVASAKLRGAEREITFYMLSHLPSPDQLDQSQAEVLNAIVASAETRYPGAVRRLEQKKQASLARRRSSGSRDKNSLDWLTFPSKGVPS